MARVSFSQPITYTQPETPFVTGVTNNTDGSETVTFIASSSTVYTYTVTITDALGDVHVHEGAPSAQNFPGNDYYGVLTDYNNGGAFTVQNYTENAGVSNSFVWLFTSAALNSGTITLYPDARGGNFVPPVCFAAGSRILTDQGEIAVEDLAVGDRVVTASGDHRPIRWLGHRTIDCSRHPEPRSVWPVRVSAHAFGESRPSRDLLVSPGHALCVMCVDEVLIPADQMLNGATIAQQQVDRVTYWHVELDGHDILVANGMPAESYLDMGNRGFFVEGNAIDLQALPDGSARTHDDYCRPFVDPGPLLDVVRRQLLARAERMGWTKEASFACHVVADGRRVEAIRGEGAVAFQVPASTRELRLISDTFVPDEMDGRGDRRILGLNMRRLSVSDASKGRVVTVDDVRLDAGFHRVERDGERMWRWTHGDALLPPSLWAGLTGLVELRIDLDGSSLRSWRRPDRALARRQA